MRFRRQTVRSLSKLRILPATENLNGHDQRQEARSLRMPRPRLEKAAQLNPSFEETAVALSEGSRMLAMTSRTCHNP